MSSSVSATKGQNMAGVGLPSVCLSLAIRGVQEQNTDC
jgi:hypothetical protein